MKKRFSLAILVMGFSGLVAQILLIRELLIVFSGNELCIGIILANWLVLEAAGCFILGSRFEKSKNELEAFTLITILFSLSLPAAIVQIRLLKRALGISIGESIGFLPMFYSSFLILLPVCILHGALFTFSCRIYSRYAGQNASSVGRVYVYETVGSLIGGIACTYLLIPYLNSFQASLWLALLNFTVCLVLLGPSWKTGFFQKTVLGALGLLILSSGYLVVTGQANRLHSYSINAQWPNHTIVHYQNSQYGNICVIENQGQYIFFLDGIPGLITPVPDIPSIEEFVHLPLLAHPDPAKLLILSGGAGGVINETLKHPTIDAVDYAELDPLILDLLKKFPTPLTQSELTDERVQVQHIDGRLLLKSTHKKYDVIFVGISEPSNLQANRFFTREFFSLARERLNREGILVLGLPGSLTYLNDELKDLNSCILHTLEQVFSSLRVIPGDGRNLFLASDSQGISIIDRLQLTERLNQRRIRAEVIVPWHIENKLHPGWQEWFSRFIEGRSQKVNTDFSPLGMFYSISHWNALLAPSFGAVFKHFEKISLRWVVFLFGIVLLVYFLVRSNTRQLFHAGISFAIITTGFAGMLFDLMIIFTFQSMYGYVFSWIGLLVASFMAGAACGALLITRILEGIRNCYASFLKIELAIICFALSFPLLFLAGKTYLANTQLFILFRMLFLIVSFVSGLLIGAQFPLANTLYLKKRTSLSKTAGMLYASDLIGGWLGGVAGAVVLLPVLGLSGTCITVGLLKLTSLTVVATLPGRHLMGGKK